MSAVTLAVQAAGGCPGTAIQRLQQRTGPVPAVLGAGACHSFACAVIDGLPERIAVLAVDGTIVAVNRAWRDFAAAQRQPGSAPLHTEIGTDYLAACRAAEVDGGAAAAGIGAVLAGAAPGFALEYDHHQPGRRRRFRMTVTPLGYGWGGVAVTHHDISTQREAEAVPRSAAVSIDCPGSTALPPAIHPAASIVTV